MWPAYGADLRPGVARGHLARPLARPGDRLSTSPARPTRPRGKRSSTTFARVVEAAGYGLIITPTFEDLGVFQRLGESTDVVRKEMYDFEDKGGRHIALRPEMTASVARAFIEHRPPVPWKCWYAGSNFRYERPQAGRYREFHQVGIEAFGSADADLDVEVDRPGLGVLRRRRARPASQLLLNSLGDAVCRPAYRELLLDYLRSPAGASCATSTGPGWRRTRCGSSTARNRRARRSSTGAPRQIDHLCDACAAHLARVEAGLEALGIPYTIDSKLVRGLDYYTRTTFEYVGRGPGVGPERASAGAGATTAWWRPWAGPPTPAVGFALGVERILLAAGGRAATASRLPARRRLDAFVVDFAGGEAARDLTARLRAAGLRADRAFDGRSPKAQFKAADRSGARLALVVGPDEAASGQGRHQGSRRRGRPGRPSPSTTSSRRCGPGSTPPRPAPDRGGPRPPQPAGRPPTAPHPPAPPRRRTPARPGSLPPMPAGANDDLFDGRPQRATGGPGPAGRPHAAADPRRGRRPGPPARHRAGRCGP